MNILHEQLEELFFIQLHSTSHSLLKRFYHSFFAVLAAAVVLCDVSRGLSVSSLSLVEFAFFAPDSCFGGYISVCCIVSCVEGS